MKTAPEVENTEYGMHPLGWLMYISVALLVVTAVALPFFVSLNLWIYIPIAYLVAGFTFSYVLLRYHNDAGWHD